MTVLAIKNQEDPEIKLLEIIEKLHEEGPIDSAVVEELTLYKYFYPDIFKLYEEKIIAVLGLFYKLNEPSDVYSFLLSGFGNAYAKEYGAKLTPVQAHIRDGIENKQFISISAPTSAGKSFSIRDFIACQEGDVVIIIPSRALVAEYINSMRRLFLDDKGVMISSFVDNVFRERRGLKRVFVLTPERARELFLTDLQLDIKVFFFDEAQISEEKGRGVLFDVLVRRIIKTFPLAKLIFAHPFIDNPDAQFKKHELNEDSQFGNSYNHAAVGKLFVYGNDSKDYLFSPYSEKGHYKKNSFHLNDGFASFAFDGERSVLVYVSKRSIKNGSYLKNFQHYISSYPIIEDARAVAIIDKIEEHLGANSTDHQSDLVNLMKKGVVIHHGSVPLDVRLLVEDFIRLGFSRICFATSTLAQGINMPFDIVWLESMRILGDGDKERALSFKNLIGRAGRLSTEQKFDYGFVYTKNPKKLKQHLNTPFYLDEESFIDKPIDEQEEDSIEFLQSIIDGTFDEQKQAPMTRVERLSEPVVLESCKNVLDIIFRNGNSPLENLSGRVNKYNRDLLKQNLRYIYEICINRDLKEGENAVFSQAVFIFILILQGKTFREIVALRFKHISNKDNGFIGQAKFSQPAELLPNSKLSRQFSIFDEFTLARDVRYDSIVYDTYDYLDQVISFSLSDPFISAFKVYIDNKSDVDRAHQMINLLTFGTNNSLHIMLMRYGFTAENIAEIEDYIRFVDENRIVFKPDILLANKNIRELVNWYLE